MSSDLVEIVHNLRTQLGQKGGAALSTLALAFRVNDTKKTGFYGFDDFDAVLNKVGIFVKRQDLSKLFRHFDHEQNEMLNYREFLRAVQGEVPPRRMNIISIAWDAISKGRKEIPAQEVIGNFTAQQHPQVLSGEKTEQQVFREFVTNFENAGNVDDIVTWEHFADFYASISAGVPYNDDWFVRMVENAWGISENPNPGEVPSALLRKIENVLREKVRQRTKAEGIESETLRKAFKQQDLDDSGLIGYNEFLYALELFGIVLEPTVSAALFAQFDVGSGKMNYAEYAAALYASDSMAASYKGLTIDNTPNSKRVYLDTGSVLVSAPSAAVPGVGTGNPQVVFVVGGPGSGKSTQCARLAEEFGVVHLSTGDLLKDEQNNADSPSSDSLSLLQDAISKYSSQGKLNFVVDGFPGSFENLDGWNNVFGNSVDLKFVLCLDCPEDILEKRLLNRGKTTGRADDEAEAVKVRFASFKKDTVPVIDQFAAQGKVVVVSAVPSPEQVYAEVRDVVGQNL
mmetsp:Transcript_14622/g.20753  ORF Transcript_14622/g.20753 Transcript_14622/m.20753 type:complete len:513 (-) Transcript_14622:137-1675(-)|eukprot:CAMPEP_0175094898 /NCGR_PEP_ID=MMETSP0086_2-20121207/3852_1 /TAXON_ID=136419 /ORGANISM="Unknown Unknown, Strain D1" /LENGTH=512 /DNA_ID=CAMNT_0016368079 /DNA_START=23 /DNA_END=1561 /DNA_ORIENTATION=+